MRYLPSVPLFRFLMVEKALAGGASLPDAAGAGHEERVGWSGEALTDLRPAGKARIGDDLIDVVADEGAFVPKGATVRIVEEDGMRVVVTQVEPI
jgi:membrane-bound serine protease (ClpP class)